MVQLTEYEKNPYEAIVEDSHRLTPEDTVEVRSILLTVPHPSFSYSEGQNIGVIVPGPHEYGRDTHFRLYTIANSPRTSKNGDVEIELCVRRCFYIDEISGEEHPGIASNYLCDASPGDRIMVVSVSDGVDAALFKCTDAIAAFTRLRQSRSLLKQSETISATTDF